MALAVGSRIGSYEVVGALGAGGMGEVYRALDTRLDRQVAIKVLPEAVRADPERTVRFEREAKLLATLNHQNIAVIHGLERINDEQFIVMELVEGETLAEVIARRGTAEVESLRSRPRDSEAAPARGGGAPRGLEIDEALQIAKQIADALEAAHEAGVIHRDLKPANVKVRPDGTVKVLDFGLAKALAGDPLTSPVALTNSPTITSPVGVTGVGVLLGTAAYMSPEQAKGKAADKRSDVWAFGCVLFEMLTGTRASAGDDISDTLANVLKIEPEWSRLPADVSPRVRLALRACLRKDPKQRIGDMQSVRLALEGAFEPLAEPDARKVDSRATGRMVRAGLLLTLGLAIGASAVVPWVVNDRNPELPVARFTLPFDSVAPVAGTGPEFTWSPDGRTLVFVGREGGVERLYRRSLDDLTATAFPGTEDARTPVVSPDGHWAAFVVRNLLRKVPLTGGPPTTVMQADHLLAGIRGADWLPDNSIIYGTVTGLWRVSADGGMAEQLTTTDVAKGETNHLLPRLLPDGIHVLFGVFSGTTSRPRLETISMKDGSRQVVMEGMARAYYVPPGYLVYAEIDLDSGTTTGGVWATAFDLQRLRPVGKPVRLFDGVNVTDNSTQMLVTANGMLTYLPGPAVANSRRLIWVARDGREDALDVPPGSYVYPRLSPDGRRVAANTQDDSGTIWVLDLERGIRDRLTAGPSSAREPVWTPDGKRIIFSTLEGPVSRVVAKTVDGVESDVVLEATDGRRAPLAVSADGRVLIIYKARGPGVGDLSLVSLDRPGAETPFLRDASNADLSPDGRWVVYQSRESGRDEIYVRRFPSADGRQLVSSGGGSRPLWRQNGREILYLDPRRNVMAVSVETEPALRLGRPTMVFERELPDFAGLRPPGRTFDVSPDGQRILMIRPELGKAAGDLVVALHWIEELKRRLPIAP